MILAGATLQTTQKVPLDRGRSDALPPAQTTAIDAIEVLLKDHFLEALTGSLAGLHTRQLLAKPTAAIQTATLAHCKVQNGSPESPLLVPHFSPTPALMAETRATAPRARYGASIPGRYRDRASGPLDAANLVLG
jgi:hypothetical protein